MEYAQRSTSRHNGIDTLSGEQEIAGRICDVYNFEITVVNFVKSYPVSVDQKTGICLEWQDITSVSGHTAFGELNFICTEFQTEQVQLPE